MQSLKEVTTKNIEEKYKLFIKNKYAHTVKALHEENVKKHSDYDSF